MSEDKRKDLDVISALNANLKLGIATGVKKYSDGVLNSEQLQHELFFAISSTQSEVDKQALSVTQTLEAKGVRMLRVGSAGSAKSQDFGVGKLQTFFTGSGTTCFIAGLFHPDYGIAASHTDSFSPILAARYLADCATLLPYFNEDILFDCTQDKLVVPQTLDVSKAVRVGMSGVLSEFKTNVLGNASASIPQGTSFMVTGLGDCEDRQVIKARADLKFLMYYREPYTDLSNRNKVVCHMRLGEDLAIGWDGPGSGRAGFGRL